MRIPGFTADNTLYASPRFYAGTSEYAVAVGTSVTPQYCGPCINGRRQCGGYSWTCGQDPNCTLGNLSYQDCPIVCQQSGFHTWSEGCGRGPLIPFID